MKKIWFPTPSQRIRIWLLLSFVLIAISGLTRTLLLIRSWGEVDASFLNLSGIFLLGSFFDVVNAVYFSTPLVLYLWLVPTRIIVKKWHRYILYFLFFVLIFTLLFNGMAEWLFWDEFSSRFNFIAVDYLVYTTEVIGNIAQSYPLGLLIAIVFVATAIILALVIPHLQKPYEAPTSFRRRSQFGFYFAMMFTACFFLVDSQYHQFSRNALANELAGNGLYELFAAYRNNELDYERFYKGMNNAEAFALVRKMIQTSEASLPVGDTFGVERQINNSGPERKLNVIMVSVESLSASFMKLFGNTQNVTPFLDSLSQHSLVFTNLYATGTRTVRGLEALSLAIPPTPGQSIVRRPNNEGLFSLGEVFRQKGYQSEYIYGGYGYFDNMNYFFASNSYNVVDRTALEDSQVHYENIWGVADEDLFTLALDRIDHETKEQPFFAHVMTTSNHRPFTYPEGRIDIPPHTGRKGAVKYTDFAIGTFIRKASKKDWFKNTIFVIVADHCASSAGKTELPVDKYHIPMLIYSPDHIQPSVVNRLMSQIDIGPTILGLLNFSYKSQFYGYDIFKLQPGRERAFISTYQSLGFLKKNRLVILSPRQEAKEFELSDKLETLSPVKGDSLVQEAVAWYQSASYAYKHGLLLRHQNEHVE
jgi:phosphoglycerol transferase MdoB-like AlkP superfamily enzyme